MTVLTTLTTAGADTGNFNLYSNVDGYISAFATGVSKAALEAGYTSYVVPNGTTTIRVMSNTACTNYIDITVIEPTTTTTSTSTTTSTTTALPFSSYTLRISFSNQPILCSETPITVYTYFGSTITTGTELFTTSSLLVPLIGYYYLVEEGSGDIYNIASGSGVIGMPTGFIC